LSKGRLCCKEDHPLILNAAAIAGFNWAAPRHRIFGYYSGSKKPPVSRLHYSGIYNNAQLLYRMIECFCKPDESARKLLFRYTESYQLPARFYTRLLKVAERLLIWLVGNIELEYIDEA